MLSSVVYAFEVLKTSCQGNYKRTRARHLDGARDWCVPRPLSVEVEQPEIPREPTDPHQRVQTLRRLYITIADLKDPRIGFTGGCPACDLKLVF